MMSINLKGNNSEDFFGRIFFFKNLKKYIFFKFINFYFFISTNKMDNMKVPELKAEAKRLGLNNYSRLRKQGLIS